MWGIPIGLIIKGAIGVGIIGLGVWAYSAVKESGREEVRTEVRAVVAGQQKAVQDAAVKQLGKLYAKATNRNEALEKGLRDIETEGADCAVSPALAAAIERLRNDPDGAGANRNP